MKLKGQVSLLTSLERVLISGRHITSDSLSCYKFHGTSRNIPYWQLLQHDIILTTYGTVVSGHTRKSSLLFDIQWYRVVLDEGTSSHLIYFAPKQLIST
jgi:SNF2 family DNA or RNA helicase